MIQMTLTDIANILGLPKASTDTKFTGISIDTRTLSSGNLFVAIPGVQVDGHDFIAEAIKKGAAAVLVSKACDTSIPHLVVNNTIEALGLIAKNWRDQFDIPFVAVTGSNGKTTLKNMIASIMLAACGNDEEQVLATQGNFNNQLGLPLTLSRLDKKNRYAVIEMGMNHFGEIEYLTKLARPSVAAITNAAAAHLEGVGDVKGVARAKAEIFLGLEPNGIAVLNRDDAFFTFWLELINHHSYMTFGFHPDADVCAIKNQQEPKTQLVSIRTPKGTIEVNLPLPGKHNVLNALAATAATLVIGIELASVKAGLEAIKPAKGRLQIHTLENGVTIIDDTYNANPVSLQAAINTLAAFAGKKILVLGDMKELGQEAKSLHQMAGDAIRQAGIDYLFTYGELSACTAQAFGEGAYHFNEQEKLVNALKPFLYNTTTILIKGSNSMQMDKVVKGLCNKETDPIRI